MLVLLQLGLGLVGVYLCYGWVRRFHMILVRNFMFFFIDSLCTSAVNRNFTVRLLWVDDGSPIMIA